MILDNGTLQVQTTTGGGLVGGIPQEATNGVILFLVIL